MTNTTQGRYNSRQEYLHYRMDSEGRTRVLFILDSHHTKDEDEEN